MKYSIYIDIDEDRSPLEVAALVKDALQDKGVTATVQYTDIDTILWTHAQETVEGIVYKGSGYGAPRHLAILGRAGYGNVPPARTGFTEGVDFTRLYPADAVGGTA